MKLKKILLYNFKNFRHETVIDFSDNITFLVGPNGFGKTTIFDAVELGLTGTISRINKVTGENIAYNKPFFQNDKNEPVCIKLWLEKNNGEKLIVVRKLPSINLDRGRIFAPKVSISQFDLFCQEEPNEEDFRRIDNIGLSKIKQNTIDKFLGIDGKYEIDKIFNLFNYIQQEETTFFLKKTEQQRSDNLSFLVKTDKIEEKIEKINKVTSIVTSKIAELEKEKKNVTQQQLEHVGYRRLFGHEFFTFDSENPFSLDNIEELDHFRNTIQKIIEFKQNFSIYEYQRKLARDIQIQKVKTMDNVLCYVVLSQLIRRPNNQWQWEKYILDNTKLFECVLLENYLQSFETITRENKRRKLLDQYYTILSLDINQITPEYFQIVQGDSLSKDFELLKTQLTNYLALRESAGQVEKNLSDLRQSRRDLIGKFNELKHQHIDETKCPFCSRQFDSFNDLKNAYDSYEVYLSEISSGHSQRLQSDQSSLYLSIERVKQKIIDEKESLTTHIDEKLLDRLQELRPWYDSSKQYVDSFKRIIQEYTNISPYQLGHLSFTTYRRQYLLNLQEFKSKLAVDDEIYSFIDVNNQESIERQVSEIVENFPELQFEIYQIDSSPNYKINKSMLDNRVLQLKNDITLEINNKFIIDDNLIVDAEDIFSTYFQNKIEMLEDISIKDLEQKKLYLTKQNNLVRNQRFQDISSQINTLQNTADRLGEINNIYKEELKQFKIGIVKQLRIPFFIYSAKMLQNYQQGLGIFLTYKKTIGNNDEKTAVIRFKSDPSNDHDVMNQLSTGQLAVVSLAFTLSLNTMFKLSDNLNFLMIDDPIQDMDAMNVLSFIEILRHGIIDSYQIILSTYSDHNALFMGYKLINSNSEVNIDFKNIREIQG